MKNYMGIILIGSLICHGLADVSHLSRNIQNGYLPPQRGYNLPIEQDNNGLNLQPHVVGEQGHGQSGNHEYLPPYQHIDDQQDERGYLPPIKDEYQFQNHNNKQDHLKEAKGFLPQLIQKQSHVEENQDQNQENQRYLPPYQEQVHNHDQNHLHQGQHRESDFDPNIEVSYHNDYATYHQHNGQQKAAPPNANEQFEDNSQGYNYSPPNQGFEDGQHQYGSPQVSDNFMIHTQNNAQKISNSQHKKHQDYFNIKQNLDYLPPKDTNFQHQQEHQPHHQQTNRDYLPPCPQNHDQQENTTPNYQNQPFEHSHQEGERDYLPPIDALELPKSSDTLHIVPPTQLGLPIQQSKSQPQIVGHINVPLPIPQIGYYFVPGVVTKLASLSDANSEKLRPAINVATFLSQLEPPSNKVTPVEYSVPLKTEIRIIPSVQTAQDIASQGYLTPNQLVSNQQHFADINYSSPESRNLENGQQYFPPLQAQEEDYFANQKHPDSQNLNEVQITHQHAEHPRSSFENFAKSAVHGVNNPQNQISRPVVTNNNQQNAYLPPVNEFQTQQSYQNKDQQLFNNPSGGENYDQVTNLQTYMNSVNSNDRYGSLQFQPQPAVKSIPPPATPPPMFSKPAAIRIYAPGMAYKVSSNAPGYLPPAKQEYSSSIGFELNEEEKNHLAQQSLQSVLGVQDDEMSQIMEQLQGHIRSIQITHHHENSENHIEDVSSIDQGQEPGINTSGQPEENPIGVISKYSSSQSTNNGYLPPSTTDFRKLRQTRHRRY